jgi:hypothetical protein
VSLIAAVLRWLQYTTRRAVLVVSSDGLLQRPNQNIAQNEAFILSDEATRKAYAKAYADTSALYYGKPPTFDEILGEIAAWRNRL